MTAAHNKIQILPIGEDAHNATIVMKHEDHTVGNALRYMIMKDPSVDFCGYTIPHPQEQKIHVRVQTKLDSDHSAVDAVKNGLINLMAACDHVLKEVQTKLPQKFPESADGLEDASAAPSGMDTSA